MTQQFSHTNYALLLVCMLISTVAAQRPSYAGSRPGGLNQRDKYHAQQFSNNINNNTTNNDVTNRFGAPDNNLTFGAVQRPPVGMPIVQPQATFVPLANAQPVSGLTGNTITFDNRIGESSPTNTQNASGILGVAATPITTVPQNSRPIDAPLPLDAHGDRDLINQLYLVPEDKRPFWFLNYQAIEAQRNGSGPNFSGAIGSRGSFQG